MLFLSPIAALSAIGLPQPQLLCNDGSPRQPDQFGVLPHAIHLCVVWASYSVPAATCFPKHCHSYILKLLHFQCALLDPQALIPCRLFGPQKLCYNLLQVSINCHTNTNTNKLSISVKLNNWCHTLLKVAKMCPKRLQRLLQSAKSCQELPKCCPKVAGQQPTLKAVLKSWPKTGLNSAPCPC